MTGPDATGPARPGGLQELLDTPGRFTVLAEAVPWRGALEDAAGERAHRFAADLRDVPGVDVVSVTDGAGGRAVLSAETLAAQLAANGQRPLVHVTCRDRNRNELAALGWRLASAGLTDVLALSGDYPHEGYLGVARPVFDLDSVSLLALYSALGGTGFSGSLLTRPPARATRAVPGELVASAPARGPRSASALYAGAAVNPFARQAREAIPQYLKLERKVAAGARFVISQSGFDVRRWHELSRYAADRALPVHLVAGVYVLNPGAAKAFHAGRVPGVRLSDGLLEAAGHWAQGEDRGRSYFLELAAMQVAVARGLGLAGVCLSGLSNADDVARLLELAAAFDGDRWRELLPLVSWSDPGEFWLHPPDPQTGLTAEEPSPWPVTGRRSLHHGLSRLAHETAFVPGTRRGDLAGQVIRAGQRAGLAPVLHAAEQVLKRPLYDCRDCGDCSLPDIAFLCPESQCVKNQRNGPCGGSRDGECEVPGKDCIWARAYDRVSSVGAQSSLLRHPVTVQDNALRHSSSWANAVTGVDLHARREAGPRPVVAVPSVRPAPPAPAAPDPAVVAPGPVVVVPEPAVAVPEQATGPQQKLSALPPTG